MGISKLKEILEEIDYPVLMEIVESCWFRDDYPCVCWNSDDELGELEAGDGNTYSCETIGAGVEHDGYFVINAHTGCGETVTYFFNLSKEVKF